MLPFFTRFYCILVFQQSYNDLPVNVARNQDRTIADLKDTLKAIKNSTTIDVRNKLSSEPPIFKDFQNETLIEMSDKKMMEKIVNPFEEMAYGMIAKTNCPLIYGLFRSNN